MGDSDKKPPMPPVVAPPECSALEDDRLAFLRSAEGMVPESVQRLLREVEKFAPPPVRADDSVTVTVHGSWNADTEPDPE